MAVTAKSTAKTAKAGAKAAPQTYPKPRCFQDIILTLQSYWAAQGCVILQPYDMEVGAGTLHPATTLRALGLGKRR